MATPTRHNVMTLQTPVVSMTTCLIIYDWLEYCCANYVNILLIYTARNRSSHEGTGVEKISRGQQSLCHTTPPVPPPLE